MPTHAAHRALIAAIEVVKERNANISDPNNEDWVSIITFDKLSGGGPVIVQPLTGDYDAAMLAATTLQACGDFGTRPRRNRADQGKESYRAQIPGGHGTHCDQQSRGVVDRWFTEPLFQFECVDQLLHTAIPSYPIFTITAPIGPRAADASGNDARQ